MIKKPTDLKSLKAIVESAKETGKKFKLIVESLSALQSASRTKIVDNNLAVLGREQQFALKPTFEKAFADWNRAFLKENDAVRYDELRSLTAAHEALSYARETLCSPIKLASIHGLGSDARSKISAEIQGAGPATLRTLAETAELTGNKDLAAAIIAENDKRNRPDRGFVSQDLAAKVWAVEVADAKKLCETMDIEHRRAVKLNRFIEGKQVTGIEMLEEGLTFGPDGVDKKEAPTAKESGMADGLKILNQLHKDQVANAANEISSDEAWANILKEAAAA